LHHPEGLRQELEPIRIGELDRRGGPGDHHQRELEVLDVERERDCGFAPHRRIEHDGVNAVSTGEQAMPRFTAVGGRDVIAAGSMATRTS
jgi:hypothetical protein